MTSDNDVWGRACRWLGAPVKGRAGTGRTISRSPAGKATPPGWWVLWDGQDTPRWEPLTLVQVHGVRRPPSRPHHPAPAVVPVFADTGAAS